VSEQGKPGQAKPARGASRPPASVEVAFWIWIVSAVVSLVFAVLAPRAKDNILASLRQSRPPGIVPSQYDHTANVLITVLVVQLVVFALLYVFLAYKVRSGRNWARMTLTVLLIIGVVYGLFNGSLLSSGVGLLISAVAVVLVYLPSASAFFAAHRRR
jgi:hypothetical protein